MADKKILEFDVVINDANKMTELAKNFEDVLGKNLVKKIQEASKAVLEAQSGSEADQKRAQQNLDALAPQITDALISGLGAGAEIFGQTIRDIIKEIQDLEDIRKTESKELGVMKQSFDIDEDTGEVDLKAGNTEIRRKILQEQLDLLKQQKIAAGEITEEESKKIPTARTILSDQEKLIEGLKQTNLENKEAIEAQIRSNEFHKLDKQTQEEIVAKTKGRLTVQKAIERSQLANKAQIDNQAVLEEKINKVKEKREALSRTDKLLAEKRLELTRSIADAEVKIQTTESDPKKQKQSLEILDVIKNEYGKLPTKIKEADDSQKRFNKNLQASNGTFAKAAKQVFNYGIAFTFLRRIYRETLRTIRDLDKALTEMAIVTTMNRQETWELTDQMSSLARETGFTISEISKLSTVFFRQGRVLSEVIELTRVAAQAARIAGIDAIASADFLTSAINAFGMSAQQALEVSDRFAALASQSASSYEELAVGLSKFAAQANIAGISIDFAMGLLAKGIETTREAPETIGTALKTVIARMRELTDLGKTFEDGMDISRVEMALRQVGVALRDEQGQFRNLELVLTELGQKWNTLNTNQQASVAVALAGTRQQSRLIAIMQDFDRTLKLVEISQDSAGATAAQHVQFMQGLEGATIRMQSAYQDFITTISNSEILISIIDLITRSIDNLSAGLTKINSRGSFWLITIGLTFAALKALTIGTGIYNKAVERKIKLEEMANNQMVLGWYNTKRLNAATALKNAQSELTAALAWKKGVGTAMWNSTMKGTIFTIKAKIIALKILNAVMAVSPIIFLVTGFLLLTSAMGKSSLATQRNSKEIEENTKQIQANIFERRRTIKSIEDVIKKMEEFNDLPFLTSSQQEELENLNSQLRELFGDDANQFMATRAVDGSIDLARQVAEAERFLHEQRQKQGQERLALINLLFDAEKALYEMRRQELIEEITPEWLPDWFMGFARGFLGEKRANDWASKNIDLEELNLQDIIGGQLNRFADIFITELNILFDESLSPATEDAFRKLLESFDFSEADANLLQTNLPQFVKENFSDIIPVLEEFSDAIDPSSSLLTRYRNFIKFFEQDIDEDIEDVLRRFIAPGLDYLSNTTPEFVEALQNLGIVSDAQIQQLASVFGDNLPDIIDVLETEVSRLEELGVPKLQAQEMAWSNLIETMEDATDAVKVYNAIFIGSFTDMANTLSKFDSQLERTRDIQSQWMEGTLGVQDLARFFDENPQLFRDMEDVERFLSGESLTGSILAQRLAEEQRAFSRLFDAQRRYNEALTQGQREDETIEQFQARKSVILAEIAAYRALTEYRGPLSQMTETQFRFNAELERYNRLSAAGAETTEDFQRVLSSQAALFEENSIKIGNSLANIEDRFTAQAATFGFGSSQITDFFRVIGGQIVPISENLVNLQGSSLTFITGLMEEYQENLDEAFNAFEEKRKFTLDNEKKLLDQQKKVYEDYFAAIDRLEQQRDRRRSREDLVNQLQRLEGATDERSRRRALEIRRELNRLDEDDSRNLIQESRRALLESFDTAYKELEATWARMTREFIRVLDGRGAALGAEFSRVVNEQTDFSGGVTDPESTPDPSDPDSLSSQIGRLEGSLSKFVTDLQEIFGSPRPPSTGSTNTGTVDEDSDLARRQAAAKAEYDNWLQQQTSASAISFIPESTKDAKKDELKQKYNVPYFRKGGMVDFEGLGMLHGSHSAPEAVLNASQTEMFMGLRNALEKVSTDSNGGGSINIENISISTASLNNNQDFNRAGETLAESFRSAIQRKGITLNTNKM